MTALAVCVAMLAAAVMLVAAACGSDSGGSGSGSGDRPAGAPEEIRIAYQLIPNGDMVVKDQGWLEDAFPGTKIDWIKFDSGGDVNTAMIAGSVDLGLAGSSPVANGLSAPLNIPYKVQWIHDVIGTAESLVASKDSGVTSIEGLAGKRVATPFASTAHYSLLAALNGAGVDPGKVDIIDLEPPDILAAWQRGDVDAAYVWNPTLSEIRKDGTVLITSADLAKRGELTADLAVVSNDFAGKYPDAVQTWVEQESRAVDLYKSDPNAAAQAIARQLSITPEEALAQVKELILLDAKQQAGAKYLGTPGSPGELAQNLLSGAQFLKDQGQVQEVPDLPVFQAALANQFVAEAGGK